jgi:hypothetical protein
VDVDPGTLTLIVIAVAVVALVGLGLALMALSRTGRMRRTYTILTAEDSGESFVEVVARKTQEVEALRAEVERLSHELVDTRVDLADAIRHVSVIRYDAFGDMGGRMSFSTAMVDDHGNGIVLTTIHARSESRTYIRGLSNGVAEAQLSPEEEQAVNAVLRGRS